MHGNAQMMSVMPTGGGKSMVFILPAWCGRGLGSTTVVIVPLIALHQDMVQQCQALDLRYVEWDGKRCADRADMVLVTPEAYFSPGCMRFIHCTKASQRLDHIVVDECHVMLN